MSYSVGAQNGMTIDLAAGSNRGTGSGSDSTNVNTLVTAANTASTQDVLVPKVYVMQGRREHQRRV